MIRCRHILTASTTPAFPFLPSNTLLAKLSRKISEEPSIRNVNDFKSLDGQICHLDLHTYLTVDGSDKGNYYFA